jgi:hypothetical protein
MKINSASQPDECLDEREPIQIPDWSRIAFKRIQPARHPKGGLGFKMPGPRGWVTEKTLREAWTLFWRSVHKLERNRSHKAESLACAADWNSRPHGERQAMGRCFKYFALQGILPITLVNPEAPYNFKYRLNTDLMSVPTSH